MSLERGDDNFLFLAIRRGCWCPVARWGLDHRVRTQSQESQSHHARTSPFPVLRTCHLASIFVKVDGREKTASHAMFQLQSSQFWLSGIINVYSRQYSHFSRSLSHEVRQQTPYFGPSQTMFTVLACISAVLSSTELASSIKLHLEATAPTSAAQRVSCSCNLCYDRIQSPVVRYSVEVLVDNSRWSGMLLLSPMPGSLKIGRAA